MADHRLRHACARAEAAAEAERMTAADIGAVVEHLRELRRRLDDRIRDCDRAVHAVEVAGEPNPDVGRPRLTDDATIIEARRLVADIEAIIERQAHA